MREFDTGATRNPAKSKLDYEGFLSPLVLEAYATVMHFHRQLEDGQLRDSDNWQLGIPKEEYIKSGWRHFMDWWKEHRDIETEEGLVFALVQLLFNANGYLHEAIKKDPTLLRRAINKATEKRQPIKVTEPIRRCADAGAQQYPGYPGIGLGCQPQLPYLK